MASVPLTAICRFFSPLNRFIVESIMLKINKSFITFFNGDRNLNTMGCISEQWQSLHFALKGVILEALLKEDSTILEWPSDMVPYFSVLKISLGSVHAGNHNLHQIVAIKWPEKREENSGGFVRAWPILSRECYFAQLVKFHSLVSLCHRKVFRSLTGFILSLAIVSSLIFSLWSSIKLRSSHKSTQIHEYSWSGTGQEASVQLL